MMAKLVTHFDGLGGGKMKIEKNGYGLMIGVPFWWIEDQELASNFRMGMGLKRKVPELGKI